MSDFLSFPAPAKLNLFLHITGRRSDGYHLLQSVFRLIDLQDMVHLAVNNSGRVSRARPLPGVSESDDLTLRAAQLLQDYSQTKLGVDLWVEKHIPMGAGLGGGSSDAATVLLALNKLWQLHLDRNELLTLAMQLGADVPFFVFGQNAWVEGIGEKLQAISMAEQHFLLLLPTVTVPTAEIFRAQELTRDTIPTKIAAFSTGCSNYSQFLSGQFHNDMQTTVCGRYPAVAACLEWLNQQVSSQQACVDWGQADRSLARMSGSGAAVFVEVPKTAGQRLLRRLPDTLGTAEVAGKVVTGLDRHPLYENCQN